MSRPIVYADDDQVLAITAEAAKRWESLLTRLAQVDGPTSVEMDRIWHAYQEAKYRPVMVRLAQVRRHRRGGLV